MEEDSGNVRLNRVNVTLTEEERELVERAAQEEGVDSSEMLRLLIVEWLKDNGVRSRVATRERGHNDR